MVIYSNTFDLVSLPHLDLRWPAKAKEKVSSRVTGTLEPRKTRRQRQGKCSLKQLDLTEEKRCKTCYFYLI